jgi:two-component system sensor histidine kinase GlrK
MRQVFPKSLHGILLLGLAAVALPLLFAILYATDQMRNFAESSEALVNESVQTTRLAQDAITQVTSLERAAGQYLVLQNDTTLNTWRDNDARLSTLAQELQLRNKSPVVTAALADLRLQQSQARDALLAGQTATFTALASSAARIGSVVNELIDGELVTLRTQTMAARRQLFWEAMLLVPLVVLSVVAFSFWLGRPLRQIDRAIAELGSGNVSNMIVVNGPVDLERLGKQLEWLRCRLVELAQERNRFLRHMSHELKTPLANIREGTELLTDGAVGELDPGQREVVTILKENGIKLQRLIENLLSFSAWQSNSLRLELSEFRLRPLIKQVLENQQLTLVSQRARLDVQAEELTLYADRGKLRLILENLLSNAIKYSPRGGIIHVTARADGPVMQLEVADGGAGIPLADRDHVFEAFYTGRAPGGHVKGTGIGLSVVNEFVNVHHGTIELVDGQYPGAHFRIRLPLRCAGEAPARETNTIAHAYRPGAVWPAGAERLRRAGRNAPESLRQPDCNRTH